MCGWLPPPGRRGAGEVIRHFGLLEHDCPLKCNNADFFPISLKLCKFLLAYTEGKPIQYKYSLLVILQKDNAQRKCPLLPFPKGHGSGVNPSLIRSQRPSGRGGAIGLHCHFQQENGNKVNLPTGPTCQKRALYCFKVVQRRVEKVPIKAGRSLLKPHRIKVQTQQLVLGMVPGLIFSRSRMESFHWMEAPSRQSEPKFLHGVSRPCLTPPAMGRHPGGRLCVRSTLGLFSLLTTASRTASYQRHRPCVRQGTKRGTQHPWVLEHPASSDSGWGSRELSLGKGHLGWGSVTWVAYSIIKISC